MPKVNTKDMIRFYINDNWVSVRPNVSISSTITDLNAKTTFAMLTHHSSANTDVPKFLDRVQVKSDNNGIIFNGVIVNISNVTPIEKNQRYSTEDYTITCEASDLKYVFTLIKSQVFVPPKYLVFDEVQGIYVEKSVSLNDIIYKLLNTSGSEQLGLVNTYNIIWDLSKVDDLSEFDDRITAGFASTNETVKDALDRLGLEFGFYWWIDTSNAFNLRLFENNPKFEVPSGFGSFYDYAYSKSIRDFVMTGDWSTYRNANTEGAENIATSERIVEDVHGKDTVREYILKARISEDLIIHESHDGGIKWITKSVEMLDDSSQMSTSDYYYTYNENVVYHNENLPTIPNTSIVRFDYIGLTNLAVRSVNERDIEKLSTRSGFKRPLVEQIETTSDARSVNDLMDVSNSKLLKYGALEFDLKLDTYYPMDLGLGSVISYRGSWLVCIDYTFQCLNNSKNELVDTHYIYTFSRNFTKYVWIDFWRKLKKYADPSTEQMMFITLNDATISAEVEFDIQLDYTKMWFASDMRFPSDELWINTVRGG